MLSTKELEKYIKNEIMSKFKEIDMKKINFEEGNEGSVEGTYVFAKNNEYHVLFAEKGKIKEDIITIEKREVLWNVLEVVSFDIAMEYAINNRKAGKDFRHALFEKEIEIYAMFNEDFRKRKSFEIEEILRKNPFNDN